MRWIKAMSLATLLSLTLLQSGCNSKKNVEKIVLEPKENMFNLEYLREQAKKTKELERIEAEKKVEEEKKPQYKIVKVLCTGYCSCQKCCGKTNGITASGERVSRGHIAAPKHIAFDTIIEIDGLGKYIVKDRGGSIKTLRDGTIRIDIWFPSHKEALKFGKRTYDAKIYNTK